MPNNATPTSAEQEFRLQRDGAIDLVFVGRVLGEGRFTSGEGTSQRHTDVCIYQTRAGKFVVEVVRGTAGWDNRWEVVVVGDGPGLLATMLTGSRKLGLASREAWNQACENCEELRPLATETIE